MKYTTEIVIELPRKEVIELFNSAENMKKWQKGFQSIEHLEGTPGEKGATSKLIYLMGKRRIEMIETITDQQFPESFHCTYDTKGVYNVVKNYFREKDEHTTLWVSENEFQFSGFMKIMSWIMPGAFKKQSCKYMEDFKAFAEKGVTVN